MRMKGKAPPPTLPQKGREFRSDCFNWNENSSFGRKTNKYCTEIRYATIDENWNLSLKKTKN